MAPQKPGSLNWGLLILLGVIWGGSFPVVSVALIGYGPLSVAAARITIAAVVLLGVAYAFGVGLPDHRGKVGRRIWLHAFGTAMFVNVLPFALLSWGQQYVTAGFAGITMAVVPLFVLPLAHLLVPGEGMNRAKVSGFLLGFCGVVILIGPGAFLSSGKETETLARLACLAATACYASGNVVTRLCPPTPRLSFSAATLVLATLVIAPFAFWLEGIPQAAPMAATLSLIYLGLLPTALATVIMVKIINSAGPSFLVLVNFQVPVWAALMGVLFLSEVLAPQFVVALGMILAGLAVSQRNRAAS